MNRYRYIQVTEHVNDTKYHDDMFEERVDFLVPEFLRNILDDFRIFNGMEFDIIDGLLDENVPTFNYIESRKWQDGYIHKK